MASDCARRRGHGRAAGDPKRPSHLGPQLGYSPVGLRRTLILVGSDGKPFSSAKLSGKPYALYFGFTRCGDVCPTTISRMVKLRQQAGGENAFQIVFVTIDPSNDGPKEVGQYAELFNSPIIGLTGSGPQIDRVKKQYGIYAQPMPNAPMGQQMEHTATVLLFDATGKFVNTITPDEPDSDALAKLKKLVASASNQKRILPLHR